MTNEFMIAATLESGRSIQWCYDTRKQVLRVFDKARKTKTSPEGQPIISCMAFDANNNVIARWHSAHGDA